MTTIHGITKRLVPLPPGVTAELLAALVGGDLSAEDAQETWELLSADPTLYARTRQAVEVQARAHRAAVFAVTDGEWKDYARTGSGRWNPDRTRSEPVLEGRAVALLQEMSGGEASVLTVSTRDPALLGRRVRFTLGTLTGALTVAESADVEPDRAVEIAGPWEQLGTDRLCVALE